MAAEPCAEGDMSRDSVKRDKKKKKKKKEGEKKKEEEAEVKGQEQPSDTPVENLAAERDEGEGKESTKSKKSKRKRSDAGEASAGDQAVVSREDKKRKRKHPVALEESSQRLTLDAAVENLVAKSDEVEGKPSSKSKKSKSMRDGAGEAQKQTALDANVENLVAESDVVEGKPSSKSKKSKSKRGDAGEASAGDQALRREDKKIKKEHPVALEMNSQPKNTSKAKDGEIKESGKGGNNSSPESSENPSAGGEEADVGGKNDKRKKKSKEETQEGIKEQEKAGRRKNKSKRASFADSTEVFKTEGGADDGTEAGKKKKKNAAQSKNKGKRVSFADSTEMFETEGGDDEGTEVVGKKKGKKADESKNKGKRVSFADSTEVFGTKGGDGEGTKAGRKKKKKATQSNNKGKRVSFADSVEVSETEGGDDGEGDSSDESKFVHGVRFTPEEDATLMEAIRDFIEMKQLGEKGLEMFRTPKKHKELRHCWDVIGKSLPHRPHNAIYMRARILLNRSDKRKWTEEEKEYIRRYVKKNGTEWKKLAHELGRCDIHVKDTWRRIKSENLKKGHWTQDEHQKLFDLVNLDLRTKAHQIKIQDNRKLRDNISWEAISDKLNTRNHKNCCLKWYDTLASPLVRKGIWADVDDYLLVEALQKDDAVCIEDVDWDSLLDHRSGEVCRQRWNQMVRGLGGHREKPFIEQVEVLSGRYCPEMIEYRQPTSDDQE